MLCTKSFASQEVRVIGIIWGKWNLYVCAEKLLWFNTNLESDFFTLILTALEGDQQLYLGGAGLRRHAESTVDEFCEVFAGPLSQGAHEKKTCASREPTA